MNVVRCDYDGCDDTRPADLDMHGWLAVELPCRPRRQVGVAAEVVRGRAAAEVFGVHQLKAKKAGVT